MVCMINRREFLRNAAICFGVALCPKLVIADTYPNFNPKYEYGDWVVTFDEVDDCILNEITDLFSEQISFIIPPEYREYIKLWVLPGGSCGTVDCLDIKTVVCWEYSPKNKKQAWFK